jgi:hypothetical protein
MLAGRVAGAGGQRREKPATLEMATTMPRRAISGASADVGAGCIGAEEVYRHDAPDHRRAAVSGEAGCDGADAGVVDQARRGAPKCSRIVGGDAAAAGLFIG